MSWEYVKLGEICDLKNGYAFKSNDYVDYSNTLNCRMSNIKPNGHFDIDYNPKYLPDTYAEKYRNFLLKDGDIVIAMTDMANDPKILGVPTIVKTNGKHLLLNQRVGQLIIRDSRRVFIPYLQIVLNRNSSKEFYKRFAGGGLQINIGKKEILSNQIPLPPLETQQKIAAILGKAGELVQNDKIILEKYDQLAQLVFLEMFGDPVNNSKEWEIRALSDLCIKVTDGTHQPPKFVEKGIPFLFISNIVDSKIDYNSEKFISQIEYNELTKSTPIEVGDILYTIVGSYGNPAIVESKKKFCFQRHIAHLKPNHEKINVYYLFAMLKSPFVKRQADRLVRGIAQKTLNLRELKTIKVYYPPSNLQNRFAEIIKHIETQKQLARQSLRKSEELFQGLLQGVFGGNALKE